MRPIREARLRQESAIRSQEQSLELIQRETELVGAGVVFLGGCIGMEMVGTAYVLRPGHSPTVYCLIATTEESLEMCGVILLIRAMLAELSGGAELLHVALALQGASPDAARAADAPRPTAQREQSTR